jgi:hypothetical protein
MRNKKRSKGSMLVKLTKGTVLSLAVIFFGIVVLHFVVSSLFE